MSHVARKYPDSVLLAAGWSLGANIMTRCAAGWLQGGMPCLLLPRDMLLPEPCALACWWCSMHRSAPCNQQTRSTECAPPTMSSCGGRHACGACGPWHAISCTYVTSTPLSITPSTSATKPADPCCECKALTLSPLLCSRRYLGEEGANTPLQAAVSMCNPFELTISNANFEKGFNR